MASDPEEAQKPEETPEAAAVAAVAALAAKAAAALVVKPARLTENEFLGEFGELYARGKASGLSPSKLVLRFCAKEGMGVLDTWLAAIDLGDSRTK